MYIVHSTSTWIKLTRLDLIKQSELSQCTLGPSIRRNLYLWCLGSHLDVWDHFLASKEPKEWNPSIYLFPSSLPKPLNHLELFTMVKFRLVFIIFAEMMGDMDSPEWRGKCRISPFIAIDHWWYWILVLAFHTTVQSDKIARSCTLQSALSLVVGPAAPYHFLAWVKFELF